MPFTSDRNPFTTLMDQSRRRDVPTGVCKGWHVCSRSQHRVASAVADAGVCTMCRVQTKETKEWKCWSPERSCQVVSSVRHVMQSLAAARSCWKVGSASSGAHSSSIQLQHLHTLAACQQLGPCMPGVIMLLLFIAIASLAPLAQDDAMLLGVMLDECCWLVAYAANSPCLQLSPSA